MKKVLVACAAAERAITELLPQYQVAAGYTVADLLCMARNEKPDAVLCTLRFDESRMFNLLHAWQRDRDLAMTPFICCAFTGLTLPGEILLNMAVAVRVLGGCDFIDLVDLPEDECRKRLAEVIDRSDIFCRLSPAPASEPGRLFR